jgi:hypothetical protein
MLVTARRPKLGSAPARQRVEERPVKDEHDAFGHALRRVVIRTKRTILFIVPIIGGTNGAVGCRDRSGFGFGISSGPVYVAVIAKSA